MVCHCPCCWIQPYDVVHLWCRVEFVQWVPEGQILHFILYGPVQAVLEVSCLPTGAGGSYLTAGLVVSHSLASCFCLVRMHADLSIILTELSFKAKVSHELRRRLGIGGWFHLGRGTQFAPSLLFREKVKCG